MPRVTACLLRHLPWLQVHTFIHPFIHPFIHQFIHPFIHPSFHPPILLFIHLFICLINHPYIPVVQSNIKHKGFNQASKFSRTTFYIMQISAI